MGVDKASIDYHGKPQLEYLFELLKTFLPNTYVSVKPGQKVDFTQDIIEDLLDTSGPINGILSAMETFPGKSFLVLACDLPFISEKTLQQLIDERDISKPATAFATQETGLPEPLAAIWESHAKAALRIHHLDEGKNCPRKFLLNTEIKLIHPKEDLELYNANNPEEYQKAREIIG